MRAQKRLNELLRMGFVVEYFDYNERIVLYKSEKFCFTKIEIYADLETESVLNVSAPHINSEEYGEMLEARGQAN